MWRTLKTSVATTHLPIAVYRVPSKFNLYIASMSDPEVFIKGYKVDRDKLKERYGTREYDPNNSRFWSIWEKFPHKYLYFATGMDESRDLHLVVVLADGLNKEELEQQPIVTLEAPYTNVFTPGIWVRR